MDLNDLLNLRDGKIQRLQVCRLPSPTVSLLRIHAVDVFIETDELIHCLKHVDVAVMCEVGKFIREGLLVRETERTNMLIALYQHTRCRYKVAVKIAAGGHELWVSSVYRTKPKHTKAMLKRAAIVRNHR